MLAQVVLLLVIAGILLYFVRRRHGVRIQAGKRLAFFAFIGLNVYAVLRPEDITWVANQLGIGRGADLLLYLLVLAFVFGMMNTYLRFGELNHQITELARALALREAEEMNRERGILPPGGVREAGKSSGPESRPRPEERSP